MTRHVSQRVLSSAPVARVKICGLTRPEDARHAETSGADFLGVILASGPRLLTLEQAATVLGPRRHGVRRVGVFGARAPDAIVRDANALDLDVVQLHGDQTPGDAAHILEQSGRAVWPVLRVEGTALPPVARELADATGALLLDAKVVGHLGGTGVTLDWAGLAEGMRDLRRRHPDATIILAGGLRVENVAHAIELLSPDVVDVSSGVELAPGVKDPDAVTRFVQTVHARNAS